MATNMVSCIPAQILSMFQKISSYTSRYVQALERISSRRLNAYFQFACGVFLVATK